MADAAISFAVEKLGDALIHKVRFLIGVEDQVRWLKDELQTMRCFLRDAAEKQGNNEYGELIRKWISDVREVAQDAEDAIEMFTLKLDKPARKRDLVRKWAGFPNHVSHLNRVGKEIKSIRTRLDEIRERRERYGIGNLGFESSSRSSRSEWIERRRRIAARFQKDRDVVGLNEDADLLFKKVILDEEIEGLSLAAIVGMGGIGKSTLARKIYNHPKTVDRFQMRAWVVVSNEYAEDDILKQIMQQLPFFLDQDQLKALEYIEDEQVRKQMHQQKLNEMRRQHQDMLKEVESVKEMLRRQEMLQQMLRKRLEGNPYFIVLDDVWESTHWDALQTAFPDEQGKKSRLLFTSRNHIITKRHGYIHKMRLLNPEESWELLLKTALIGRCPHDLEETGRDILEKCHGLPLAITVAGGLLVGESRSGWDRVLKQIKNYHLETSEIGSNVSAILELSYHNLPSQLKPCFLCLAFFREDAVIRAKRLVHIWVALGFVQDSEEEIAMSYLDELIKRNLILVKDMSIDDRVQYCYVHDLLRELSIKKAKEEIGFNDEGGSSSSSYNRPRHRVVRCMEEGLVTSDDDRNYNNKHLRSLFLNIEVSPNYFTTPSYWESFELLRILDIEGCKLPTLPSTIRALIGLRYLRLREVGTLTLPSWLDVLKNLQVIDIAECKMVSLPDVALKLDSLLHFYIDHRCSFPDSFKTSSWANLKTLKYVMSDNLLQGFGGCLRKLGVQVVDSDREAEEKLGRLLAESAGTVQVLHLRWTTERSPSLPLLNSLDNLSKLKVNGPLYAFANANRFPRNITHLTLSQCAFIHPDLMQQLGELTKLLYLKLDRGTSVESIQVSREGFPRLEVLHLRNMPWLKNMEIEEGGMLELQRLQIYECPNLDTWNLRKQLKSAEIIIVDDKFGS